MSRTTLSFETLHMKLITKKEMRESYLQETGGRGSEMADVASLLTGMRALPRLVPLMLGPNAL